MHIPFGLFVILSLLGGDTRIAAATRLKEPKRSEELFRVAQKQLDKNNWGRAFEVACKLREPERTCMLNYIFELLFEYGKGRRGALSSSSVVADKMGEPERSTKLMKVVHAHIEGKEFDQALTTALYIHPAQRKNAFEKVHEGCLLDSRYSETARNLNPRKELEFTEGLMRLLKVSPWHSAI